MTLLGGRKQVRNISQAATFRQLGILVLDGSGSMTEQTAGKISKAEAVSQAVNAFFSRFKNSSLKNNFCFAIVNYDHRSIVKMQPTEVNDLDDHADYDPTQDLNGATYISEGLKDAKKIAEKFLDQSEQGGLSRSVIILVMTDGVDMTQPETKSVANEIKRNPKIKIASCFFETLGASKEDMLECQDYMKSLCSNDKDGLMFASVSEAEDLRKFFVKSMSNMAAI